MDRYIVAWGTRRYIELDQRPDWAMEAYLARFIILAQYELTDQ